MDGAAITAIDEEIGPVRYCIECREWWPDDREFYQAGDASCIACVDERRARRREQMRAASWRYRLRLGATPRVAYQ